MADRVSEELIEEIRRRNDIVEVISGYVTLKKSGKTWKGNCPFHSDRDPSFTVSQERQLFKCFGCGEGGNVISFVMKADSLPFMEALEKLARRVGMAVERTPGAQERESERKRLLRVNEVACRYFQALLADERAGREAREYLERRGLGPEMIKDYRLGLSGPGWSGLAELLRQKGLSQEDAVTAGLLLPRNGGGCYDRFRARVIFPIFNLDGAVVGFGGRSLGEEQPKYLNTPETPVFMKGRLLYGLFQGRADIGKADEAVVVEGYMDVLSCHGVGIRNVVASLGTALTAEQVRLLGRFTRNIKLCYDADSAGMKAAVRGIELFESEGCRVEVVDLEQGTDPDEIVREGGADALLSRLQEARSIYDYRLDLSLRSHGGDGTAVLREMLPVLAGIRDGVRRNQAIADLAARLSPASGGQSRVMLTEQMIHGELARFTRQARGRAGRAVGDGYAVRAVAGGRDESSLYRDAERELLRAVLSRPEAWAGIEGELGPEDFEQENCRLIFSRLLQGGGVLDDEEMHALGRTGGPETESLLADLRLKDCEFSGQVVSDCLERLRERRAKRRLQELEAEIRDGLERGTMNASDEQYKEYSSLVSFLHGR